MEKAKRLMPQLFRTPQLMQTRDLVNNIHENHGIMIFIVIMMFKKRETIGVAWNGFRQVSRPRD